MQSVYQLATFHSGKVTAGLLPPPPFFFQEERRAGLRKQKSFQEFSALPVTQPQTFQELCGRECFATSPYLSTQSERREQWFDAGASWPPTAYRKPLEVATPTPPLRFAIGAHMLHLLVWGSKHSMERRHELPSRPPTANSLKQWSADKIKKSLQWINFYAKVEY